MSKKLVHAPHLGHNVRLGGYTPSKHRPNAVRLKHLLTGALVLPASTNRRAHADASLRQMFLNDQYGDCVIAGRAHRIGEFTGAAGSPFVYADAQVLAEYERIGGYNPKDPSTDQGCDMTVAADDGVHVGYADGSKDVGYLIVDPTNEVEVKSAIELFEVGDFACCLPDAWISPFPSADGFVWGVAGDPDPSNGHCYELVDYDADGVILDTWGLYGKHPWAALAKYGADAAGGVLIVHLNADQVIKASQKSPDGVAWADLIAAFNAMGGNVAPIPTPPAPVPAPPQPSPPPAPPTPAPPAPTSTPTLADATTWALSKVKGAMMTHKHIEAAVKSGLSEHWPK